MAGFLFDAILSIDKTTEILIMTVFLSFLRKQESRSSDKHWIVVEIAVLALEAGLACVSSAPLTL
ncbi:hypothetical protein MCHI_001889 [Candidatus Magnetoovum chiemensis]|nr:hypothetical protein MCHI_001889 [Candidatus Magnetoovum chiemensis]